MNKKTKVIWVSVTLGLSLYLGLQLSHYKTYLWNSIFANHWSDKVSRIGTFVQESDTAEAKSKIVKVIRDYDVDGLIDQARFNYSSSGIKEPMDKVIIGEVLGNYRIYSVPKNTKNESKFSKGERLHDLTILEKGDSEVRLNNYPDVIFANKIDFSRKEGYLYDVNEQFYEEYGLHAEEGDKIMVEFVSYNFEYYGLSLGANDEAIMHYIATLPKTLNK